jgi:hypothetical protein
MTFKDYVEGLNKLLKEKPDSAELQVIHARDDEGNGFMPVLYGPLIGEYDDEGEFNTEEGNHNAVCIN